MPRVGSAALERGRNLSARGCEAKHEYEECGGAEDAADRVEAVPALQEATRTPRRMQTAHFAWTFYGEDALRLRSG